MKILATDGFSQAGVDILEKAGHSVEVKQVPQDGLADYINKNGIGVLLVRSATQVPAALIDATELKVVARAGVGLDNIDVKHAQKKGIKVVNTPGASSHSVAELVFAHLFSLARYLNDTNRNMPLEGETHFKEMKKYCEAGFELRGKTIGIIGFGRIGQETAKMALALGLNVLYYDAQLEKCELCVEIAQNKLCFVLHRTDFDRLLAEADFITLHVPSQSKPLIDAVAIEKMKDGAVLINAARGGVVDEKAVLDALDKDKIHSAAFDVFENEPKPMLRLLMHPKVSLSPHIGGSTCDAQERIGTELAENIINALK